MRNTHANRLQVVLFLLFCFLVPVSRLFPGTFSQRASGTPTTQTASRETLPLSSGAGGPAAVADFHCGTPITLGQQLFSWPPEVFSPAYRTGKEKNKKLCDEKAPGFAEGLCYREASNQRTFDYPVNLLLSQLGWPSDLLLSKYLQRPVCRLDPSKPGVTTPPLTFPPPPPYNACVVGAILWWGGINVCDLFHNLIVEPLLTAVTQFLTASDSFVWSTPDAITYNNPSLLYYWTLCLWLVNSLLVLSISFAGLQLMVSQGSWLSRSQALEFLPRLIFAFLAAAFSLHFIQIWIDGNNALCSLFQDHTILSMITTQTTGFAVLLQLLYGALLLYLLFQAMMRLALLMLLLVLSPLWMFAWATPQTESIGRFGVTATIGLSLTQALQLLSLQVGVKVLTSILHTSNPQYLWFNLGTGIGLLYITSLIPVYMQRMIFRWSVSLSLPSLPHLKIPTHRSGGGEEE